MTAKKIPVKKILILSANPIGTNRIRFDEEVREIEEGLKRSKNRAQFQIKQKFAVRLRDFRRSLLDYGPHILHFTGHGEKEGLLVEDKQGFATTFTPEALSGLLKLLSRGIECVILSACYSAEHATAINQHIKYVIGMKRAIKDKAGIEFAVGFYDGLGAGKSVKEAFQFGKNAIHQQFPDLPEHLIPILKCNKKIKEFDSVTTGETKKKEMKRAQYLPAWSATLKLKDYPLYRRIAIISLFVILIVFFIGVWLRHYNEVNVQITIKEGRLLAEARKALEGDPTVALQIARQAYRLNKSKPAKQLMQEIHQENRFYKIVTEQQAEVTSMAVSAKSKRMVTGAPDGTTRIWNLKGKLLHSFKGHRGRMEAAIFSPDGKRILTAANDGKIRLLNADGKELQVFNGHDVPVQDAAFSKDGNLILTGSIDKTAKLWNLSGELLHTFTGHYKEVTSVAFVGNQHTMLTGSWDGRIYLWDAEDFSKQLEIETYKSVYSAAVSPNGQYIAAGQSEGHVQVWDILGNLIESFVAHETEVLSISFSPNGKFILTSSRDNVACLWDLKGIEIHSFKGHTGSVFTAIFSNDGDYVLTGSIDHTVRLWKVETTLDELLKQDGIEPLTDEQKRKYGIQKLQKIKITGGKR